MGAGSLLLIDLDGVLVTGSNGDSRIGQEILRVHPNLAAELDAFTFPIAILTHRCRHEAHQLIAALGLETGKLAGVFSANDIVFSDLSVNGFFSLLYRGSRKSRILPSISRRLNVHAANIVFIDDKRGNVEDMAAHGVGLTVKVPSINTIFAAILCRAFRHGYKTEGGNTGKCKSSRLPLFSWKFPVNSLVASS